ncbi:hypothetical protein D3C72_2303810 [compost metagenome]
MATTSAMSVSASYNPITSVSPHSRVSPGSGSNTGLSWVSWKVTDTAPLSTSASLRSSAWLPVVFSFSWIQGITILFKRLMMTPLGAFRL